MSNILLSVCSKAQRLRDNPVRLTFTLSSALNAGEGLFGTINAEVSVAAGTPGRSTERGWAPKLYSVTRRYQIYAILVTPATHKGTSTHPRDLCFSCPPPVILNVEGIRPELFVNVRLPDTCDCLALLTCSLAFTIPRRHAGVETEVLCASAHLTLHNGQLELS